MRLRLILQPRMGRGRGEVKAYEVHGSSGNSGAMARFGAEAAEVCAHLQSVRQIAIWIAAKCSGETRRRSGPGRTEKGAMAFQVLGFFNQDRRIRRVSVFAQSQDGGKACGLG